MIQAWKDLRFSAKLTLIFFLVLSLTIGVITIRQSYSSFRFLEEKSLEDMENLAEQVILNFTQTLEDIENSCYVAMISREVPKNMSGSATYAVQKYTLATMNQQREIIYKQRQMVLDGEDISGKLHEMMRQAIDDACTNYLNGETADDWDFAGLRRHFMNWLCLPTDFNYTTEQLGDLTKEGIADELYKRGMDILTAKEKRYGAKTMRELERICLLRNVDSKWMEHIDNMDQLKQGMGLRGYGQHDPVVEYRIEGFAMFDEMIASIREDAVHMLLTIEIRQQNAEPKREQIAKPTGDNAPGDTGAKAPAPVRVTKIGRNDPCPCGSGLKWKKCTCKEYHPDL